MSRPAVLELPPTPTLDLEQILWQAGVAHIAGLDEAGRGAWAGPVAAAAVILPPDCAQTLSGVRDSKQMTARQRTQSAILIRQQAIAWGVGMASALEIDELGIVPATRLAMQRALDSMQQTANHLLIDALRLPALSTPQTALVKGDRRSLSIAAASVLAKTSRDALLCEMEHNFPGYGFAQHKGYGTAAHRTALAHLGACPQHRQSFQPVKSTVKET